jgi:hypothetical protein
MPQGTCPTTLGAAASNRRCARLERAGRSPRRARERRQNLFKKTSVQRCGGALARAARSPAALHREIAASARETSCEQRATRALGGRMTCSRARAANAETLLAASSLSGPESRGADGALRAAGGPVARPARAGTASSQQHDLADLEPRPPPAGRPIAGRPREVDDATCLPRHASRSRRGCSSRPRIPLRRPTWRDVRRDISARAELPWVCRRPGRRHVAPRGLHSRVQEYGLGVVECPTEAGSATNVAANATCAWRMIDVQCRGSTARPACHCARAAPDGPPRAPRIVNDDMYLT